MTGCYYHCDFLTREYNLFVNLREWFYRYFRTPILTSPNNYLEASFLRSSLFETSNKVNMKLYEPYTILLSDS